MSKKEIMADQSRESISRLLKALAGNNTVEMKAAQDALAQAGESAIPALAEMITGLEAETIRWRAAEVMGRIGGPAAPELIRLSRNDSPLVRRMAVDALRMTGDARGIQVMQTALKDRSEKVRETAAMALNQLGVAQDPDSAPSPEYEDPAVEARFQTAVRAELSPNRFTDCFKIMGWYFFAERSYQVLTSTQDRDLIRALAALPVSVMVWVPLSIPVLAAALGVITLYKNWLDNLGLILAVPLGWLLTWILGRGRIAGRPLSLWSAIGYAMLVVIAGFIVFSEMRFVVISFRALGLQGGAILVGIFLLALAAAIGIGLHIGVSLPVIIPGIAGLIIGWLLLDSIGYISAYIIAFCVVVGVGAAVLPAWVISRVLKRYDGTIARQSVLSLAILLNIALIWLLLFDGWMYLFQPVV